MQASEKGGTKASNEQSDGDSPLRRLTIRLPPPPPHAASRLPAAVRRAFRHLFSALQLDDIFADDGDVTVGHTKVCRPLDCPHSECLQLPGAESNLCRS